jgi:hypothetical protein
MQFGDTSTGALQRQRPGALSIAGLMGLICKFLNNHD